MFVAGDVEVQETVVVARYYLTASDELNDERSAAEDCHSAHMAPGAR